VASHQLSAFLVLRVVPVFLTAAGVDLVRTAVFLTSVFASALGLGAALGRAGAATFSSTFAVAVRVRRGATAAAAYTFVIVDPASIPILPGWEAAALAAILALIAAMRTRN